ncbi:guanylin-like [Scomber japonicus]|uniref:guanylin-like n=1 Tax=Scomber japonicus TaxID=13676 RepID=UPI00230676E2|nr:guanylin-like [Scomber japonicus]
MKAAITTVAFLILALSWTSEAVQVEENGLSFSLEGVKRLQVLAESIGFTGQQNPRLRMSSVSLCTDPLLPQEFLSLCKQRGGSASLARLAMVPMDVCEICAFAACAGC